MRRVLCVAMVCAGRNMTVHAFFYVIGVWRTGLCYAARMHANFVKDPARGAMFNAKGGD